MIRNCAIASRNRKNIGSCDNDYTFNLLYKFTFHLLIVNFLTTSKDSVQARNVNFAEVPAYTIYWGYSD